MDKTIEKEFSIGDLLNLLVIRNDFDKLGNILEIKFTPIVPTKHLLVMSFYDEDKNQISQTNLMAKCNYKNILFDNILLISNLKNDSLKESKDKCFTYNQEYKLKFLNKKIYYMKFYIQTFNLLNQSENSFSQVFNLKKMKILSKEEIKDLSLNNISESINKNKEKNKNINLILSELDKINKDLSKKQKDLEQKEKEINNQEIYINKQKKIIEQKIVQFKEEILLFGDKCYGECVNEINNKMQRLNKKITQIENNIANKYRILKDKLNSNKQNSNGNINNLISQEKKDKIANLEIKIKFLEDSLSKLKDKNSKNEEKIKNYVINEEKFNNTIKKLKDELILTNSQIKEKEKKNKMNNNIINSNMSISNISYVDNKDNMSLASMLSKVKNKKVKNIISFEIDKHQKEIISKYFAYNFILEYKLKPINYNDKDILTASILLMHLCTNPIELYNKFELGHIIILYKLISNIYINNTNSYQDLIKEGINDLYNKLPEFKNNISVFMSNNKRQGFEFNPLIELNIIFGSSIIEKKGNNLLINEINFSNIIFNKCISFNNFISKNNYNVSKISNNNNNNERKNKIKKITIISNLILSIIFCSSIQELLSIIKQIISYFSNSIKDKEIINYLIKIKFGKILLLIFQKILNSDIFLEKIKNNENEIKELISYIIECILFIMAYMNNINNKEQKEMNQNLDINIEKDIGFILWENKFINYLKKNINDFLKYYSEIKNNPLNKFVSIEQNYYDTIQNNFLKSIVLITNLAIYCSNLRIKIKDTFLETIKDIQNNIKNINNKKDKNQKEDKYISFINKNISLLSKLLI